MEAIETFELPAENAIPITEKRCYTVEDLQIILGIAALLCDGYCIFCR